LAWIGPQNNLRSGIPIQYRSEIPQISQAEIVAIHGRILEAGLSTQVYDKGPEKFVRKFDPVEEMSAVVSIQPGWQGDHGWAVYFKQGARRCLLLDAVDGLSSEEALWTALSSWATFSPRIALPRQFPGRLFYPNEASHIIQDCWDHLDDLSASPGFVDKSPICQAEMLKFSEGLSGLNHSSWIPQPAAEASEKSAKIADIAAFSRVRPVADGPNQWDMHRSSAFTDGPASLSGSDVGTESVPGSGLMGTCATSRRHPYT
jgi:hypothetical protein